jgi:hypothetical protein
LVLFDSALKVIFLGTSLVTLVVVFVIAHQMSTGIFKRFFLFLKLAIIVIFVNRVDALTPDYGLTAVLGTQSADYAYRTVWSILLMLSFTLLYVDWRNTSLDQPIKPRGTMRVES